MRTVDMMLLFDRAMDVIAAWRWSDFTSGGADASGQSAREKQVPRCARNDSQKGKCKSNGKCRSRFPSGMTEREARATATASTNAGISPLRRKGAPSIEMTEYG
jgi:hypothetical protein